jgi:hypothetical protein
VKDLEGQKGQMPHFLCSENVKQVPTVDCLFGRCFRETVAPIIEAFYHSVRWMFSGWLILADVDLLEEKNIAEWLADKR